MQKVCVIRESDSPCMSVLRCKFYRVNRELRNPITQVIDSAFLSPSPSVGRFPSYSASTSSLPCLFIPTLERVSTAATKKPRISHHRARGWRHSLHGLKTTDLSGGCARVASAAGCLHFLPPNDCWGRILSTSGSVTASRGRGDPGCEYVRAEDMSFYGRDSDGKVETQRQMVLNKSSCCSERRDALSSVFLPFLPCSSRRGSSSSLRFLVPLPLRGT